MKNSVRRITDGAFMSAIIGILIVLDGQSGLLIDGLLFWVLPIPIIVYTVKYNVSSGLVVSVALSLMAFILTVPHIAILISFSNIIGLAFAYGVNKKLSNSITFILTFIATFVYYILSLVIFAAFFGYDAVAEMASITKMINDVASSLHINSGDFMNILFITNPFIKMIFNFTLFIPSLIALMQTLITMMVSKQILTRLKLANFDRVNIYNFMIKKRTATILLLILLLTYVYDISFATRLDNVIMIVQFTIQLVFIILGTLLCLIYVIMLKKPLLSLLVAIIVIGFPLIMLALGIVNVFTNLRDNIVRRIINER